jgi:hypothetical protein
MVGRTGLPGDFGVRALAPYEDGFAFAGYGGYVGEFSPGSGVCIATQAGEDLDWVAPLGQDLLVGGEYNFNGGPGLDGPISLTFLQRQ